MSIEAGAIVQVNGNQEGVVAWNPWEDVIANEVPVVTGVALQADLLVNPDKVEVVGTYSPTIANPKECGWGTANPCNYVGIGPNGAECLRFTEAGIMLMSRAQERGQLLPVSLYPLCQDEISDAGNGQPSEKMVRANRITTGTIALREIESFKVNDVEYAIAEVVPVKETTKIEVEAIYSDYMEMIRTFVAEGIIEVDEPTQVQQDWAKRASMGNPELAQSFALLARITQQAYKQRYLEGMPELIDLKSENLEQCTGFTSIERMHFLRMFAREQRKLEQAEHHPDMGDLPKVLYMTPSDE